MFFKYRLFFTFLFILGHFSFANSFFLLFGSDNCDDCQEILELWGDYSEEAYQGTLVYINIDNQQNFIFLKKIEDELQISQASMTFPLILFGDKFLSDIDEFMEAFVDNDESIPALPELQSLKGLRAELAKKEKLPASLNWEFHEESRGSAEKTSTKSAQEQVPLLYFVQKGCQNCSRQLRELRVLVKDLPELSVQCLDISTQIGQIMLQRTKEKFAIENDAKNLVPMIVWNDGYFAERLVKAEELLFLRDKASDDAFWLEPPSDAEKRSVQVVQGQLLKQATITIIAAAGLIDGINPCAFATSIFLISYLLYLKRRPKQIALIGLAFCAGVFISYLLFGLGFSYVIDLLNHLVWLKTVLYLLFASAALILGVLHFRDAFKFRSSGRASAMDMGLSNKTHHKIHQQIKKFTSVHGALWLPAALLLGAVVSSMELACTGQIYLPTIAAINSGGLNARAVSLLFLYNFFFIIPLVIITFLASLGIGAKALAAWAKKHVFATKLLMGILFLSLTILMLSFAWIEKPVAQENETESVECI